MGRIGKRGWTESLRIYYSPGATDVLESRILNIRYYLCVSSSRRLCVCSLKPVETQQGADALKTAFWKHDGES